MGAPPRPPGRILTAGPPFNGPLREAATMATLRPHPIVLDAHVWTIVLIVVAFILVSGLLTVVW